MDKLFPVQTLKAAGVLASRVSLDQVRIKKAAFQSSGDWVGVPTIDTEHITHTITPGVYSFDEKANTLEVEIGFVTTLKAPKDQAPSFKIEAAFIARYHLTTTPPPKEMQELFFGGFSKANALLNVWPYWREFASSSNDRMGLPHWNLPVLRLLPEPEEPKTATKKPGVSQKKGAGSSAPVAATKALPKGKKKG
jgi:hypothetical protein